MTNVVKHFLMLALLTQCLPAVGDDSAEQPEFDAAAIEFFEKEVRPLLAKRCYECHSADTEEPSGGLRLDSRTAAIKGGDTGSAMTPHKPDESLLIDAINYGELYQMPPKSKLPATEIAVLTKWVSIGAPWPKGDAAGAAHDKSFDLAARVASHWCWQPIGNPPRPTLQHSDWSQQPLDDYILAKLESAGLPPGPPAEKRTLIRRAYFDLVGLPPPPAEVDAFVKEASPDAFERVVTGLLESPHFGERWARHWMDLMRYSETYGHEFDYPIPFAHQYRDYLIRAFNADVPYDLFVTEHIAGDLIKPARRHPTEGFNESVIGTSSWWLGEATHAPVDVGGDEAGRIDNQIDVFSKTFLGLTVACARCHDHKFDAISTQDYYALAGFLQSSRRHEAVLDRHGAIATAAAQLAKLKQEASAVIANAFTSDDASGAMFAQYLLASREVLFGEPKPTATPQPSDDIVFEDFESEVYEGWTTTGTAFGDGPQSQSTTPKYQGDVGAHGNGWVNSHNMRGDDDVARGDGHVGTLTSKVFTIERPIIKFLVGGGNHTDKTCVNLLVDGKVVRSQAGYNQNKMRPAEFDVAEFLGKPARIRVVDKKKGGWGNIGIDHIVFTNGETKHRRPIAAVAAEHQVDIDRLARWVRALSNADVKDRDHPLHVWARIAESPNEKQFAAFRSQLEQDAKASEVFDERYPVLSDFNDFDNWFVTGPAFGDRPATNSEWDAAGTTAAKLRGGTANSGRISKQLQGTLRSPTFTLEHSNIYYRLKGKGVKIRLILDGYFMDTYSALLFKGFAFDVESPDKFTWHRQAQDVERYLGHRGYIEILDYGDGSVEIDEIRFSNEGPPPRALNSVAVKVLSNDTNSVETLAEAYELAWESARGEVPATSQPQTFDSNDLVALWNWVAENELLPVTTDIAKTLSDTHQAMARVHIPAVDRVLSLTDGAPENQRIHIRGNHRVLGKEAPRRLLTALVKDAPVTRRGSGRLELAQQIADPANPLTARVMVNRIWHHLTGRGIVASTDNFGVLGQKPTHPELLDHLATEFVRDGWSIKQLISKIMMSSTYQLSSSPSKEGSARDPQNLLLHRARIRRLQGEAIRDSILAISGRLDRATFGPSVPIHVTSFMQGRGRPANAGPLDGNGRRSLYIEVRRNFLPPMMLAFDTPSPFNAVGRRNVSNVPAQALIMMNDPFVVEQAGLWAKRVVDDDQTTTGRIEAMYLIAFARPPSEQELADGTAFLEQQGESLGLTSAQAQNDLRVWTDFCHVLMNVKEFMFVN